MGDMRCMALINKALVSLLPKVAGAMDIKDFRPISLVNGPIKIFDKILTTRHAVALSKLLGHHKSAFVKGPSLHDKTFACYEEPNDRVKTRHHLSI
jgi:hypothetical protein